MANLLSGDLGISDSKQERDSQEPADRFLTDSRLSGKAEQHCNMVFSQRPERPTWCHLMFDRLYREAGYFPFPAPAVLSRIPLITGKMWQ